MLLFQVTVLYIAIYHFSGFIHELIYLFIQQIFMKQLLCARYSSGLWNKTNLWPHGTSSVPCGMRGKCYFCFQVQIQMSVCSILCQSRG